jgi:zinc protease
MTLVSERPAAGPPRDWSFPAFERLEVAGGRVIACDLPGRPIAVASLVVDAGAVTEPAGLEGLARLSAATLTEGTTTLGSYEFAVASEKLGASPHASAGWDSLRVGIELPVGELAAGIELLAQAVRSPALADDAVQRVRAERLDDILVEASQPASRAASTFAGHLFTPASRYAVPEGGTAASVGAITADDIRRFVADRLGKRVATLVVVGDLGGVDVGELAAPLFDGWADATPAERRGDVVATGGGRRTVVVDRPGAVQSMLYVGHDGPPRSMPDYVPVTTMAMVLGGMFSSRLNMKLREEKGYAYGAFGSFDARRDGGQFAARAAVQSEVTVPALTDLVAEVERMQAAGATADELEQARAYRAGVFPITFADSGAVASGLADLVMHDFPDDHFDALRQGVLDVTLDEVNAAASGRLRPAELLTVVVGEAEPLLADLESAGLGPVEVVRDSA